LIPQCVGTVPLARNSLLRPFSPGLGGPSIGVCRIGPLFAGCGWVQREGGPLEQIRPGDVVWFSPNEKHWHGATATTGMTHVAIQESLNGKVVDWMEKVTDEQYQAGSTAS
jgi:hypothetical protein